MIERVEIRGIEGRRFVDVSNLRSQRVNVSYSTNINNVTKKNDLAEVEFSLSTNYLSVGMIRIEGKIYYSGKVDEIVDSWNEKHAIADKEAAAEIMNVPMASCITIIFTLSRDLNLPPPLPPPRINPAEKKKKEGGRDTQYL